MKNKQTILITGGAGLVGSSLIDKLRNEYKIICLDRSVKPGLKKFFSHSVKFVEGEIMDEELLDELVKQCDAIIHLAGGGGNPACVSDPVWAARTHILGTDLLLKKALKYKIKKFIFASSQSVYTTFHKRAYPLGEDINLEPDDFYGMLKKTAEDLILRSGVNYVILRFANIYGQSKFMPLQAGGAINNFIMSAADKREMLIYGSGGQGIDYVNLRDAVRALAAALKKNNDAIYNVGSGKLVKIKEIAALVQNIFKSKSNKKIKIKSLPASAGKLWPDRLMSIEKIRKDLNWRPEVSLSRGVEEMINNYFDKI